MRIFATPLILLLLLLPTAAFSELKVGVYQNSPKVFIDELGAPAGFFVDIINAIALAENWQLTYVTCVWDECLTKLEKAELDIMLDVAYSPQRERRFDFNREEVIFSWSIVYQAAGKKIDSILDLDRQKIAVLKGSIQYRELRARAQGFGIRPDYVEVDAFAEALSLVDQNKVDFVLFNRFFGNRHMASHRLTASSVLVRPSQLKFAASKGRNQHLLPAIDRQLLLLKQDRQSVYYRSMQRWLAQKPSEKIPLWAKWSIAILSLLLLVSFVIALFNRAYLRRKKSELKRVSSLLDSAINATPDLIFFKDRQGVYLGCNEAFERFTGKKHAQIVGRSDFDLFEPDVAEFFRENDHQMLDSLLPRKNEEWVSYPDGNRVLLDTLKAPFYDSDKKLIGVLGVSRDITAHHQLEQQLRESEQHFKTLYDQAPLPYQSLDAVGNILSVNQAWLNMLEFDSEQEVIGRNIGELLSTDSMALLPGRFAQFIKEGEVCCKEYDMHTKSGRHLKVSVDGKIRTDKSGSFLQTHCILTDITRQRQSEDRLKLFRQQIDRSRDAIYVIDAKTAAFIDVNEAAGRMLGYSMQEISSMSMLDISSRMKTQQQWEAEVLKVKQDINGLSMEDLHIARDGRPVAVDMSIIFQSQQGDGVLIASARDATDRKKIEGELLHKEAVLEHLAHHDTLTELPNRLLFFDRLHQAMHKASRSESIIALLFIDLDNFKEINDSLGHSIGDLLLQAVSQRLPLSTREDDIVARLGGDEFTVITGPLTRPLDAGVLAQKLVQQLQIPFDIEGYQLHISASIGISIFPNDGENVENLLKNADSAMYRAKSEGRGNYQFYTEDMTARAFERMQMESELRVAIEQQQFVLHYQPQFEISTGRIVGAEALIRWHHPRLGLVQPGSFIPLAEETGQIRQIGAWVLSTVCHKLVDWAADGCQPVRVAVNVSGKQVIKGDKSLYKVVEKILRESACDPHLLELEITEGIVMHNPEQSIQDLLKLQALGIEISIDDFGTGYSSLSQLKQLPINKLKIDRSFIRDIQHDPNDQAITRAIIAMGKSLQLKILAEGVENEVQLAFMRQEGCDEVQGFYYSLPLAEEDFLELLSRHRS